VISRDYITRGMRARAEDLVTTELGPKTGLEIRSALESEVTAECWTRLDRAIARQADETGLIDLRPSPADRIRRLMIGRLQRLAARNFKTGKATAGRMREGSLVMMAQ
jgi:type IV secretory pathway VirD2 relaxase